MNNNMEASDDSHAKAANPPPPTLTSSPGRSELENDDDVRSKDEFVVPLLSDANERALIRKIDLKLLPILCLIYLMAFLDRVNIGNAVIFGLTKDLKLTGNQYNAALTVFFVPYILFEIPANLLLKRLRPHIWLALCMFFFGLVMTLQGFVQSYSGLIATRFFLGLAEAGVFPGCFYLISMWYNRSEAQKRFTVFFSSTQLAGAFGGLLASAIGKMDGIRGYHAWRWIFILEGLLTCVIALGSLFIIPDFPEEAKWLTDDERACVRNRLPVERRDSSIKSYPTRQIFLMFFKDPKVFLGGLMYFSLIVPAYGFAYFAPTVIQTYGYSPIQTQLHSVPPSAAAFVFSLFIATLSDRIHHRFLFALTSILIAVTGVAILLTTHHNTHLEYGALFLVAIGTFSAMPVVICWFTMNLQGHLARGLGTAWQIGFGNIGGIIATFSFLSKDAPLYETGYRILLGFLCLGAASVSGYFAQVWMENSRLRGGRGKGHKHML